MTYVFEHPLAGPHQGEDDLPPPAFDQIFTKLAAATGPGSASNAPFFRNFVEIQSKAGKAGAPERVVNAIWDMVCKDDDRLG